MTEVSLELVGLSRRFGSVVALDGLTFSVPPGQVFGFLGPNGAGKTTAGGRARQLYPEVASVEQVNSGMMILTLAPDADSQQVLDAARAAGAVEHFSFASRRLSEVFRDVTGEEA